MQLSGAKADVTKRLPAWVPSEARLYLEHTEDGRTFRSLARSTGCHASTVMRQVRKTESRRDDPLVDAALTQLGQVRRIRKVGPTVDFEEPRPMIQDLPDDQTFERDATRTLRAMMHPGALLAVTPDVETAVVVRDGADGVPRRVATVARRVAEAMALKDWIACSGQGKVARYRITGAGRQALNRLMAAAETSRAGFAEAPTRFERTAPAGLFGADDARPRPAERRGVGSESPLQKLTHRRDKAGQPYLSPSLVEVGERLRFDFELANMDGLAGTDWNSLMAPATGGAVKHSGGASERRLAARERLQAALRRLGPELGEVALMTCCQQLGMERAEARLAMPARSGKYVLRIALNMLARHYETRGDSAAHDMIY